MKTASRVLGALAGVAALLALAADRPGITDATSAIDAAKRYVKARCTVETPCKFKPEREGKQWRVWVQLTRRDSANSLPRPYPGGTLILYFDARGNLIRRLEGD